MKTENQVERGDREKEPKYSTKDSCQTTSEEDKEETENFKNNQGTINKWQ